MTKTLVRNPEALNKIMYIKIIQILLGEVIFSERVPFLRKFFTAVES